MEELSKVSDNPFFTAGLGLAGLGVVLATAQKGLRHGATMFKRRLLVDVELNVKDESYTWFLQWMTFHHRSQQPSRFTPRIHHLALHTQKITHPNGSVQTQFALLPGPGRHIIRYKSAFLLVNRVRETKSMDMQSGRPWESITLTTLYSQRQVLQDVFTEAHKLAQQSTEGKTIVYQPRSTSWERFGEPHRKRPIGSVILDKGVKEGITEDVKQFLSRSQWYFERGIPYRRGYLLHGPPGTGKTSFIQELAGLLDYDIAILNMNERGMTDDRLNYLLGIIPSRSIVLLEDVDSAFPTLTHANNEGYRGSYVTSSGLLNALDGVTSVEERVMFLTTNRVDRLHPALIRPGRVDMIVRLGEVTRYQASKMWYRFYSDLDGCQRYEAEFLTALEALGAVHPESTSTSNRPKNPTTAAALQGLFSRNKDDMQGSIDTASTLFRDEEGEAVHGEAVQGPAMQGRPIPTTL